MKGTLSPSAEGRLRTAACGSFPANAVAAAAGAAREAAPVACVSQNTHTRTRNYGHSSMPCLRVKLRLVGLELRFVKLRPIAASHSIILVHTLPRGGEEHERHLLE